MDIPNQKKDPLSNCEDALHSTELLFIFHKMANRFREEIYLSINLKNMQHLLFSIFKNSEKNTKTLLCLSYAVYHEKKERLKNDF